MVLKPDYICADRPTRLSTVEVGGPFSNQMITDLGGISGSYTNNENYIQTVCPHSSVPSNEGVWFNFTDTVYIEKNWDYLYVFDGPDTESSRLINKYTGDSLHRNLLGTIKSRLIIKVDV